MGQFKVSNKRIIDIAFWIFVFTSTISDHTIIGNLGYLVFIGITGLQIINKKKLPFPAYIALEFLFIAFCAFHIYFGYAVNKSVAINRLRTLILCFVFDWCLYYVALQYKDWKALAKSYVSAVLLGLLLTLFLNFQEIVNGRFGSNDTSGISLLGVNIANLNATMIGYISMICIFFVSLLYDNRTDRKKMVIYDVLFIMFIILSSTRKVLIAIPIIIIFSRYFREKSNRLLKLGKYLVFIIITVYVGYYSIMHIPLLYRTVGSRIQTLFIYLSEGSVVESSLRSRLRLESLAQASFAAKPWMGWGLDNFKYTLNNGGYYAHSNYYEIVVSVGIIGGVFYYIKYIYSIIHCVKVIKISTSENASIIKTFLLFMLIAIVLEYWQVTYFYRLMMLPYVLANAICTISYRERVYSK